MRRLTDHYGFPGNGAAGLVGNLRAESAILPNRIEGSRGAPMTARDFQGRTRAFTPEEVMNRNRQRRQGPFHPGVGLAQWTTESRRRGLFEYVYQGRQLGAGILFNMDAQIDYLVAELRTPPYRRVNGILMRPASTPEQTSDEVVYSYEIPNAILIPNPSPPPRRLRLRPGSGNKTAEEVYQKRRGFARWALAVWQGRQEEVVTA